MSEINLFLTVTFLDFLYTSFTQIKECSWHHWINGKSWWVLCSFHASGVQISSYCWSFFLLIFEKSDFTEWQDTVWWVDTWHWRSQRRSEVVRAGVGRVIISTLHSGTFQNLKKKCGSLERPKTTLWMSMFNFQQQIFLQIQQTIFVSFINFSSVLRCLYFSLLKMILK